MPTDKFWEIAHGDPYFTSWLEQVDRLCMRFLDVDLLSIPEAREEPYSLDQRIWWDRTPASYFLWLLGAMKDGTSEIDIDQHFARMTKWGYSWQHSD